MTEKNFPENIKQWLIDCIYNGDTNSGFINVGLTDQIRQDIAHRMAPHVFQGLMDATDYGQFVDAIILASPTPGYIKRPCREFSDADFMEQINGVYDDLLLALEKDGGKTRKEMHLMMYDEELIEKKEE